MSLTLTRRHNVDRFGYLVPTKYGNMPMVGAVATYRPGEGRVGGAVAVEEGTENKIATPTTFAGWSIGGGAVLDNDGSFHPSQAKFARVTTTAWNFQSNTIPAANGQTWSVSYIARRGTGDGEPRAAIMIMNASNAHVSNINPTFSSRNIGGGWVRYEATFTINYANTGYIRVRFYVTATNGGYHDFALPQLEAKPFATSFVNGTRAAGALSYPITLGRKGTIGFWWNKSKRNASGYEMPFRLANNVFEANILDVSAGVNDVSASVSWNPGEWHHFAYAWDMDASGTKQWLFIDGQLKATSTSAPPDPTAYSTLYVGWGGDGYWFNGLIDELLILPYAASEEEIRAWYEADGPIPPHPDALLQWDWQAVRPATMVAL